MSNEKTMLSDKKIGTRLRVMRETTNYRQYQIANLLGISQQQVARIEIGSASVKTSMLVKLAKFYDVSIDYLIGISPVSSKIYNDDNKYIGARLRKIRKSFKCSREEAADVAGLTVQQLTRYENGTVGIKATTLVKLANFYNLSLDSLLGTLIDTQSSGYGAFLRETRENLGYTKTQIAKVLNVPIKYIDLQEAGKKEIKPQSLVDLAEFYNISLDCLLGLSCEQAPFYAKENCNVG